MIEVIKSGPQLSIQDLGRFNYRHLGVSQAGAADSDALRIANDSRFGLGGGIFTTDEDKAIELARDHFDTGMVFINSFGLAQPDMPFGGVKDSGYGREHGGFGVKEFVNAKSIMLLD